MSNSFPPVSFTFLLLWSSDQKNATMDRQLLSCTAALFFLFFPEAFLSEGWPSNEERWHSRRYCLHPVACAVTVACPVMLFSLLTGRDGERGRERERGRMRERDGGREVVAGFYIPIWGE